MIPDYINSWLGQWVWVPVSILISAVFGTTVWWVIDWARNGR